MSDNRSIDWANGERVGQLGDPGKLKLMSRHGRFPGHAGSYSDNDGHSRLSVVIDPGHIRIKVKVCACVMCVQYTIIIFHPAS